MSDRAELRRLAEASLNAEETWHHEADLHGSLACTYGESGDYFVEQDAAYIAAARPDVVLGLLDEIDKAVQEIGRLRSLCDAAALEITDHWDAHCDDQGCGPVNLLDRLEQERGGGYIDEFTVEHIKRTLEERDQAQDDFHQAMELARKYSAERDQLRAVAVRLKLALQELESRVFEDGAPDDVLEETQGILADPEVEKL